MSSEDVGNNAIQVKRVSLVALSLVALVLCALMLIRAATLASAFTLGPMFSYVLSRRVVVGRVFAGESWAVRGRSAGCARMTDAGSAFTLGLVFSYVLSRRVVGDASSPESHR